MKTIIAFAGSNSKTSINKQLATYAASLTEGLNVKILDLNDYEVPLFGTDYNEENGIPENAQEFFEEIKETDGIILSLAEHNGAYSAAFKNIFDWMSIIDGKTFQNKPMLLMATSPGARGGLSVLEVAKNRFPYHDGNIVAEFSLPSFGDNFSNGMISNSELDATLKSQIAFFQSKL